MLEDSISNSPSKTNKSIHEARLIRKNKRKKPDEISQIKSDHEHIVDQHITIQDFYKDSEDEYSEKEAKNSTFLVAKPPAIIRNYIPFEMEKSLAIADHMSTYQIKPNKTNVWPETQGFFSCQNLAELEIEQQSKDLSANYNPNSSFNITESELISCCNNAENILQPTALKKGDIGNSIEQELLHKKNDNMFLVNSILDDFSQYPLSEEQTRINFIAQELSPKKNDDMFLVNSILEDFSQSPLSKEQTRINTSYQYTPEFRLRRRPEKTYSRKFLNTTKTKLDKRFEEQTSDDDHNNFSSLSIQEDFTVGDLSNNHATPTSTNNSQRLCENLLNLSVYFAQNQGLSDDCIYDNQQDTRLFSDKMSDLVTDILTLRCIYPNKIRYDSYNSTEDFFGFRNRGNAERDVIDIENDNLDSMHTTLNITHDLNICENRVPDISLNQEDIATFEDWNEDDCHDVFAFINTENILHEENVKNQNKKLENIVELAENKSSKNCEKHTISGTDDSDTENVNNDENIFKNSEDFEWNDDCDLFQNFQTPITSKGKHATAHEQEHKTNQLQIHQQVQVFPSTSKMAAQGFKTAGGNNVHISKKAIDSVEKLLKEFENDNKDNYNCEEDLKEMKCKAYVKTHSFESKESSLSDIKEINNIENKEQIINLNIGFQTAKGRNITISEKAQQSVKSILNEFSLDNGHSFENALENMKQNINKKNNECKHLVQLPNMSNNCKNSSMNTPRLNNMGFQTANGKQLITSTKAQKSVDKLLKEFFDDNKEDFLSDLKSIKNEVNKKNDKYKKAIKNTNNVDSHHCSENDENLTGIMLSEWPLETQVETAPPKAETLASILLKTNNYEIQEKGTENNVFNINMGFKTANGKHVSISNKAQQTVKKLLQEFNTDVDIKMYEHDLIEMKTKIEIKNRELKQNHESSIKSKASQVKKNYDDTTLTELPINSKYFSQQNISPKPMIDKRKYSLDNSDIASPGSSLSPPAKVLKRDLNSSKSSVISRKNLLSLTKRHRSKRNSLTIQHQEIPKVNKEKYAFNADVETPIKSSVSLGANIQTPNLREFISNAPLTSTPRIKVSLNSPQIIKDTDFQPITWKNNDDSISNKSANISNHTTKLSDNSSLNITLNSSNPTANERIGRLKMYGKAPAVSPILIETHHSCRPSGLRRTRSMLKKTEK